jgi:hypothetical protein
MDNQQEIPKEQLAYLGGLIDGEGCVSFSVNRKHGRANVSFQIAPLVSMANTEKVLVDHYCAILDSLGVGRYINHRDARGRNAESWQVVTNGLKRTVKLLPYLVEWCRGKKKQNAADVLEYCTLRLADWHGAPFTQQQLELVDRVQARNYGGTGSILIDYTRSSRSSKFPNG